MSNNDSEPQSKEYRSLAFVSGKGGVGKTTLAANIAKLVSSKCVNVLLIDLDFQNTGSTSLFCRIYQFGQHTTSVFDIIEYDSVDFVHVMKISDSLFFLPAVDPRSPPRTIRMKDPGQLREQLSSLLDQLHQQQSIELFVLDCHGGIDDVSIATASLCDYSIVVTEPDSVTFSGTLGLIDHYYSHYGNVDGCRKYPRIEFVLNRIPSKYRWKDLSRIHKSYLSRRLGVYTKRKTVMSYIPTEVYVADSFGDYPFHVEFAPKTLFSKKLELIIYRLFPEERHRWLAKRSSDRLDGKRYQRRIHRRVRSSDELNLRSVITGYAWRSCFIIVAIVLLIVDATLTPSGSRPLVGSPFLSILLPFGLALVFYFSYECLILWRMLIYFRDKLRIQKGISRVLTDELISIRRLQIMKTRLLFYSTFVLFGVLVLAVLTLLPGLFIAWYQDANG